MNEESTRQKTNNKKHNKPDPGFKLLSEHLSRENEELLEKILPKYELPSSLKKYDIASLPISLRPPEFKDFIDYNLNTWTCGSCDINN